MENCCNLYNYNYYIRYEGSSTIYMYAWSFIVLVYFLFDRFVCDFNS